MTHKQKIHRLIQLGLLARTMVLSQDEMDEFRELALWAANELSLSHRHTGE